MSVNNSEKIELTKCWLLDMPINKYVTTYDYPFMMIIRVSSGWIYRFWEEEKQDYINNIFVKE